MKKIKESLSIGMPKRESQSPWMNLISNILGGVLLCVALAYALQMAQAMVTTSLLNDEFYSTEKFTSRGPLYTLTHYPAANNHVLFNFIRSMLPGADSYFPGPARWLSFVFLTGFFGLTIGFFAKQRRFLEGVLCTFPFLTSTLFLDLGLQARGFGLVFLLTALATLATVQFEATRRTLWLVVLGGCVFLSSWTIPSAVMLGGLFIIFLLPLDWKRVMITGVCTLLAILAVYSPILGDVVKEASTYDFGEYDSITAPLQTLALYWFSWDFADHQLATGLVAATVGLVPLILSARRWREHRITLILTGASLMLFLVFVVMKTPIHRAACYILIPLAISFSLTLGKTWADSKTGGLIRIVAALVLITLTVPTIWARSKDFHYLPAENYLGPALFIRDHFATNHEIATLSKITAPKNLDAHPERYVYGINQEKFATSEQAILDNRRRITVEERISPDELSPQAIAVDFPQVHIGYQRIVFLPPNRKGISSANLEQKPGTKSRRSWQLTCEVDKSATKLYLHTPFLSLSKPPTFYQLDANGKKQAIEHRHLEFFGQLVALSLSSLESSGKIHIQMTTTEPMSSADDLKLQIWAHDFPRVED